MSMRSRLDKAEINVEPRNRNPSGLSGGRRHDDDSGATACRAPASLESSLLQLLLVRVHGELLLLLPGHGVYVDEGGAGGRLPGLELENKLLTGRGSPVGNRLGPNRWPIFLKDGFFGGRIIKFS